MHWQRNLWLCLLFRNLYWLHRSSLRNFRLSLSYCHRGDRIGRGRRFVQLEKRGNGKSNADTCGSQGTGSEQCLNVLQPGCRGFRNEDRRVL